MSISPDDITTVVDRWAGPLLAWLRGRSKSPEDIVQEVFCRLVQQDRLPERTSAWLFQVAANLLREEARKQKRRERREIGAARTSVGWHDPADGLIQEELRASVDALPPEQRDAVILRTWGALTLAETAEALGLSIATVHRRYAAAIETLSLQWNVHENNERETMQQKTLENFECRGDGNP